MLIPNNPEIDFTELNRRIAAEMARYQQTNDGQPLPVFVPGASGADYPLPSTWQDVLILEDEALVKAAYLYLFGRTVDDTSLKHWINELRSGVDKFEFLAALRDSPEGQQYNAPAHGLRKARLKRKLRRIPFIGRLLLSAYGCLNTDTRHHGYMARLHHLQLQHNMQAQQLSILQRVLHEQLPKQLDKLLQDQHQQAEHVLHLDNQLQEAKLVNQELRARLSQLENCPAQEAITEAQTGTAPQIQTLSSISDSFYLAFENRFRGDESTLRERMSYYLPLLTDVPPLQQGMPLVDIGCGRGEWLQMLPDSCQRIGIDLNAMNVHTCRERGLQAVQADALHWLAQQSDNSIAAISAFHVIEHLSFEQLNTLLDQCMRVLAPGGMLIFETPNPENLITAATHFHTDPPHRHPLPPAFTEFLVQFKGFNETTIHRLTPIPREYARAEDSDVAKRCDTLFYGPQDYAVTARK
jgi:O-antigen chain-terminating methyltransferase